MLEPLAVDFGMPAKRRVFVVEAVIVAAGQ
jgi:hypothetical protein